MSFRNAAILFNLLLVFLIAAVVEANPYLAKPGDASLKTRVATCAVTGGFLHLYAALDYGLFDKYGLKVEFVAIRGGAVSLAALATDEIQFLYCAADSPISGMASGIDAKLVASPLVGLPWVLLARKDVMRPEDLKGKSIGVTRPGDLTFRVARALLKKFNLTEEDVKLRPFGGTGQVEPFNAMRAGLTEASLVTPPLDALARREGFNLVYRLNDLGLPSVYSSLLTNSKTLSERPGLVQKAVAALAESIYLVEKNPDKAKASLAKVLKINAQDTLQSAYDAYAKTSLVNRRVVVPENAVAGVIEVAREAGVKVKKKAPEIIDNSFAENLGKSGFLRELWGDEMAR